jgi:hypothetical protein
VVASGGLDLIKKLDIDRCDSLVAAGVLLLAYGIFQIYPPASFIISGVVLGVLGMIGAISGNHKIAR